MLLDPRFWLAIVIWTAVVAFGSYNKGHSVAHTAAEAERGKANTAAALRLAEGTQIALELTTAAMNDLAALTLKRNQERKNDKAAADERNARFDDGTLGLFFNVENCGAAPSANSSVAAGKTRAKLDASSSRFVSGLTDEGDAGIKDLNVCIDSYNAVRDKYNAK